MEREIKNNEKAYIEHGHPEHESHNHENHTHSRSGVTIWLVIGVVVLIVLLIIWLTIADLLGDTDVAAQLINIVQVPADNLKLT